MTSTLARITLFSFLFLFFIPHFTFAEIKTFVRDYTYQASEYDSKVTCRVLALEQVKRLLLEEIGAYLESSSEIKNFQLKKDQIVILTAGIIKSEIVDENWDGNTLKYKIRVKMVTNSDDVIKSIDIFRKDRLKIKELEEVRRKAEALSREIANLKEKLKSGKDNKQTNIQKYENSVNRLSATNWFLEGTALSESGKHKEAIDAYTNAIKLNLDGEFAYYNRGVAYGNTKNYARAVNDFSKAIELNTQFKEAFYNRGVCSRELGDNEQAIIDFSRAIELDSQDYSAYFSRGHAYYRLKNYKMAIIDFDKSIELNPKFLNVYLMRAALYFFLKNLEQAIKYCETDIDFDEQDSELAADYYHICARVYAKLGNQPQCIKNAKISARLGNKEAQAFLRKYRIKW